MSAILTRSRFRANPELFRLPQDTSINPDGGLESTVALERSADLAIGDALDEISQRLVRMPFEEWPRETVEQVSEAARDWEIVRVDEISGLQEQLDPENLQEYVEANPGVSLGNFNLKIYDISPNNLAAFYMRNPVNGSLRLHNGQPFVAWEFFRGYLATLISAIINSYGTENGSFFIIQFIDEGTGDVVASNLFTQNQNREQILDMLTQMQNFEVSEGFDFLQGTFTRIIIGNPGTGAGGKTPKHLSKIRSVWGPKLDGYCAPMCILMHTATDNQRHNWKKKEKQHRDRAQRFSKEIDCDYTEWGFNDIEKAAIKLDIKIIVLDAFSYVTLFETEHSNYAQTIVLLLDQVSKHFMMCTNPSALDINKKWCDQCEKLVRKKSFATHQCKTHNCFFCRQSFQSEKDKNEHFKVDDWSDCGNCWRKLPTKCYSRHIEVCRGGSKRCPECKETFLDSAISTHYTAMSVDEHKQVCGENQKFCQVCRHRHGSAERCRITLTKSEYSHRYDVGKIVAFDIESIRMPDGTQRPNFIDARRVLKSAVSESKDDYLERAVNSTYGHISFAGEDCLHDFCRWAIRQKRTTFVAHNLKGYDGVIIHGYMRYEMNIETRPVLSGLKVMFFTFGSNKMIDSLNHLSQPLATLPKTLGIKIPGLVKGYFPHKFNSEENQEYVGSLPSAEYFEPEQMSAKSRKEFQDWYTEECEKGGEWDLKDVVRRYCRQDVDILAICIGEYRRQWIELTKLDPLCHVTIASLCLATYRNGHIPIDGIHILSEEEAKFARKSMKGGRTEVFKLRAGFGKYELGYIDVQSLYPATQYYDRMPCGIPKIYKAPNIPLDWLREDVEGFAMVDFIPPKTIQGVKPKDFIPLLGAYSNGKLQFDTNRHDQQVVSIVELREAKKLGYGFENVTEVHHYRQTVDLFKSYVKTFLKIKVESSKPPKDIDACVKEHKARFDIDLDPKELAKPENKGRRTLAKMALNNLWGKLAQREHDQLRLCNPRDYFKLLSRWIKGEIEVKNISVDIDLQDVVSVAFRELKIKTDMVRYKNNVAIGAYVTACARLRLYKVLGDPRLAGRICYCDTDSVIYIKDDESYNPPEGKFLGDWEEECQNGCFNDFVAIGPKCYAIRNTITGEQKLRVKGFRMTGVAEELFSFDSLVHCLEGKKLEVSYPNNFTRTKRSVRVRPLDKKLEFNPEGKRKMIKGSHDLAPY